MAGLDGLSGTYKGERIDYRLGVSYRWNEDLMTYAQVSTGYKGGGVNPTPYVPDQAVPFGPEKLTTYEVGVKSDFSIADCRSMRLASTIYIMTFR